LDLGPSGQDLTGGLDRLDLGPSGQGARFRAAFGGRDPGGVVWSN
jgi:hypothetical protein